MPHFLGWCPLRKDSALWDHVLASIGQRNVINSSEAPVVCRRGKSADPNVVHMAFRTTSSRQVTIRKLVFNAFNEGFFAMGQRAKREWEMRPTKRKRRSTVPNTTVGLALTCGEQLEQIALYEKEQAEKNQTKAQAVQDRAQRAHIKELQRAQHLNDAREILLQYQSNKDRCRSKLAVKHLKALLMSVGFKAKDLKKKKTDLLQMYWRRHVDVQFEVRIGMNVSRYFHDKLYNGEVSKLYKDGGLILYEDGDTEDLDFEQIAYANRLYVKENTKGCSVRGSNRHECLSIF